MLKDNFQVPFDLYNQHWDDVHWFWRQQSDKKGGKFTTKKNLDMLLIVVLVLLLLFATLLTPIKVFASVLQVQAQVKVAGIKYLNFSKPLWTVQNGLRNVKGIFKPAKYNWTLNWDKSDAKLKDWLDFCCHFIFLIWHQSLSDFHIWIVAYSYWTQLKTGKWVEKNGGFGQ